MPRIALSLLAAWLLLPVAGAEVDLARLPPPAAAKVDFATSIRPLLERHCFECHGEKKQKSGFRIDLKAAAIKGGDIGIPIIPGDSARSPLIHYVAGLVEEMQMPPKGEKLSPTEISLLRAWIDQGAVWPDGLDTTTRSKRDHWAFQKAVKPPIPTVPGITSRNPIDAFIADRLVKEGLTASPPADRRTLARRLHFTLTGLPPTPAELKRFIEDPAADAYDRLVDRLLASERHGERWARYWLDIVHFGESHGYDKDKPRPNAWPYRDYVIRAANGDLPYSRFVQEQLAGDILFPDDPRAITATGFIAAGPWDFVGHVELPESKTDGLIARYNDRDDMVTTAMSTFLSLTVHCARCHDHKFDPISQEDYYRLQAVFAGVDRAERTIDADVATAARRRDLTYRKSEIEARLREIAEAAQKTAHPEIQAIDSELAELRVTQPAAAETKRPATLGYHSAIATEAATAKWVQLDFPEPVTLERVILIPAFEIYGGHPGPAFGFPPRFRIDASDDPEFGNFKTLRDETAADFPTPGNAPVSTDGGGLKARHVRITATRLWQRTGDWIFALGEAVVLADGQNIAARAQIRALDSIEAPPSWGRSNLTDRISVAGLPDGNWSDWLAQTVAAEQRRDRVKVLTQLRLEKIEAHLPDVLRGERTRLQMELQEKESGLGRLPKTQPVFAAAAKFKAEGNFKPAGKPRAVHLLKRGEVKQPGPEMKPGAPGCLPGLPSELDEVIVDDEGSRRAGLARWLTRPDNLLLRRSLVNRVWQFHFGRGLVDSPNDFGHMGALPTHPELLDWLAYWFLDNGESLKALHRLIVTSATFQQSSAARPDMARLDSDNRFLWRMNRMRLDAEAVRDTVLLASGQLDLRMGGPSDQQFFFKDDHSPIYDYTRFDVDSPAARRRSIYRFIVRSVPDPFMESLDCADPALLVPRRNTTLTALQALATLNDPFILRQSEHFAARLEREHPTTAARIAAACEITLNRPPSAGELAKLSAHAEQHGLPNTCRLLFNLSEFAFVD